MNTVYDEDGSLVTVSRREARDVRRTGGLGRSRVPQTVESCVNPACVNYPWPPLLATGPKARECAGCGQVMKREEV